MHSKKERGQAIVLIALAIVGLVSFTGLAIDGGNAFANQRQAQNAADTAALSTALAAIRDTTPTLGELQTVARNLAAANGYDNNDPNITVTVNWPPDNTSPYSGNTEYIQVIIESQVDTFFAPVVGIDTTTSTVQAVARAKPTDTKIPFDGAAVVALNDSLPSQMKNCGISAQSNATIWNLVGGGIHSNGCAYDKHGKVFYPGDKCVGTVGSSSGFTGCTQTVASVPVTITDLIAMTPPQPPCDGTAEGGYVVPSNPSSFTFENGIYCVSNFDAFDGPTVILNNATLYVTDTDYDIKLNGNDGGFMGTAYNSGTGSIYDNYFIIIAPGNNTCPSFQSQDQSFVLRGNGSVGITGTIWAPTACLDIRGNGLSDAFKSQIVAWNVSSNGNGTLNVNYNPDENAKEQVPPQIELSE